MRRPCDRRNAAHNFDSNERQKHRQATWVPWQRGLHLRQGTGRVPCALHSGGSLEDRREGRTKPPTTHRPCDPTRVMSSCVLSYKGFVISDKFRMRNNYFLCGHCTQVLEERWPSPPCWPADLSPCSSAACPCLSPQ